MAAEMEFAGCSLSQIERKLEETEDKVAAVTEELGEVDAELEDPYLSKKRRAELQKKRPYLVKKEEYLVKREQQLRDMVILLQGQLLQKMAASGASTSGTGGAPHEQPTRGQQGDASPTLSNPRIGMAGLVGGGAALMLYKAVVHKVCSMERDGGLPWVGDQQRGGGRLAAEQGAAVWRLVGRPGPAPAGGARSRAHAAAGVARLRGKQAAGAGAAVHGAGRCGGSRIHGGPCGARRGGARLQRGRGPGRALWHVGAFRLMGGHHTWLRGPRCLAPGPAPNCTCVWGAYHRSCSAPSMNGGARAVVVLT